MQLYIYHCIVSFQITKAIEIKKLTLLSKICSLGVWENEVINQLVNHSEILDICSYDLMFGIFVPFVINLLFFFHLCSILRVTKLLFIYLQPISVNDRLE